MITEIVEIEVKPGEEAAFEAGVAQAIPLFQTLQGLPRHGTASHHREAVEIPALRQVGDAGRPYWCISAARRISRNGGGWSAPTSRPRPWWSTRASPSPGFEQT